MLEKTILEKITIKLNQVPIKAIANKVGFIKRKRKVHVKDFLKAACYMTFCKVCSLSVFATTIGSIANCTISKQALEKKFNPECVDLFRKTLVSIIAQLSTFKEEAQKGIFSSFKRVILQDSTKISLPKKLAEHFPGSKNQTNKPNAIMKIQATYDLLTETFISFALTSFTSNDQSASKDILKFLQPSDLVLRDLGYFALNVFRQIAAKGAFFLSRYRYGVAIFDALGKRVDLLDYLQKHKTIDKVLYLGVTEKFQVRLVAVPVPEKIASERRRKLKQNRDKRLNPTKEQLVLLGWEIFITNVNNKIWDVETIAKIYGIRWRIEIIFKTWKSHFNLTVVTNGSRFYVETLVYAKLIWITLFQVFFQQLYKYVFTTTQKHLSLLKVAQFIQENLTIIILYSNQTSDNFLEQCIKHCCYEKRKKRTNYQKTLFQYSFASEI